ncbi:hypothetical protein BSKO_08568 [Bryopsis sp. KO-2023]|nr:hypothetical protein BSKO_08568 [Bryopsis sp. KO-2023]
MSNALVVPASLQQEDVFVVAERMARKYTNTLPGPVWKGGARLDFEQAHGRCASEMTGFGDLDADSVFGCGASDLGCGFEESLVGREASFVRDVVDSCSASRRIIDEDNGMFRPRRPFETERVVQGHPSKTLSSLPAWRMDSSINGESRLGRDDMLGRCPAGDVFAYHLTTDIDECIREHTRMPDADSKGMGFFAEDHKQHDRNERPSVSRTGQACDANASAFNTEAGSLDGGFLRESREESPKDKLLSPSFELPTLGRATSKEPFQEPSFLELADSPWRSVTSMDDVDFGDLGSNFIEQDSLLPTSNACFDDRCVETCNHHILDAGPSILGMSTRGWGLAKSQACSNPFNGLDDGNLEGSVSVKTEPDSPRDADYVPDEFNMGSSNEDSEDEGDIKTRPTKSRRLHQGQQRRCITRNRSCPEAPRQGKTMGSRGRSTRARTSPQVYHRVGVARDSKQSGVLKKFSSLVIDEIKLRQVTTCSELVEKLIKEENEQANADYVKRRVYDIVNVLEAIGMIHKDEQKQVSWRGPRNMVAQHPEIEELQQQIRDLRVSIKQKTMYDMQLKDNYAAMMGLVEKNRDRPILEEDKRDDIVPLPFVLVRIPKTGVVHVHIADDGGDIDFGENPLMMHGDMEVLRELKLNDMDDGKAGDRNSCDLIEPMTPCPSSGRIERSCGAMDTTPCSTSVESEEETMHSRRVASSLSLERVLSPDYANVSNCAFKRGNRNSCLPENQFAPSSTCFSMGA